MDDDNDYFGVELLEEFDVLEEVRQFFEIRLTAFGLRFTEDVAQGLDILLHPRTRSSPLHGRYAKAPKTIPKLKFGV